MPEKAQHIYVFGNGNTVANEQPTLSQESDVDALKIENKELKENLEWAMKQLYIQSTIIKSYLS